MLDSTSTCGVQELLSASRVFVIGEREYSFNEEDPIFFITEAINALNYHNTEDGCASCG